MLTDAMKAVLKQNRVDEDNVESVSSEMVVTFKDGTERRLCENWTR